MRTAFHKLAAQLDHRWAQPRMSAYLEGDLTERQARRLHSHVSICPECRRVLERLSTLLRTLPLLRERGARDSSVADRTVDAVNRRL